MNLIPWALKEYRQGEKELFQHSIHPPSSTNNNNQRIRSHHGQPRTPSANANAEGDPTTLTTPNTLDLSTLALLPRDRDRAAVGGNLAGSGAGAGASPAASPLISHAEVPLGGGGGGGGGRDLAAARRTRVGSGTPASPSSSPSSTPSSGGVLSTLARGAVAGGGEKDGDTRAGLSVASGGHGGREVWQGGRWRRQAAGSGQAPPPPPPPPSQQNGATTTGGAASGGGGGEKDEISSPSTTLTSMIPRERERDESPVSPIPSSLPPHPPGELTIHYHDHHHHHY